MSFQNKLDNIFLAENTEIESVDEFVSLIERDCQPYLKTKNTLFRGMTFSTTPEIGIKTVNIQQLIEKGARAIALACTGFASLGTAVKLSRRLTIPVVDPVVAAGSIIRYLMMQTRADA